jgi:hypothetical protein
MPHAVESATLADVLERVLDKGVVIWRPSWRRPTAATGPNGFPRSKPFGRSAACEDAPAAGPTRSSQTGPLTPASTAAV